MPADEIEAKLRVTDPAALRRRLAAAGLEARDTVFEVNRLFDFADGRLRRGGSALRVREEYRDSGGALLGTRLTYKGPLAEGPLKRRPEAELRVEAAGPLLDVFAALGLAETFRYEKRRTPFTGGPCEVVLDDLPGLGHFMEIEGSTEESVTAELARLGLAEAPTIRTDYVHLLIAHLEEAGRDLTRAVFDDAG